MVLNGPPSVPFGPSAASGGTHAIQETCHIKVTNSLLKLPRRPDLAGERISACGNFSARSRNYARHCNDVQFEPVTMLADCDSSR